MAREIYLLLPINNDEVINLLASTSDTMKKLLCYSVNWLKSGKKFEFMKYSLGVLNSVLWLREYNSGN